MDDNGDDDLTLQTFRSVTSTFLAARSRWITCGFAIRKIYLRQFSIWRQSELKVTFFEERYSIPRATWWANWVKSRDVSFWLEPGQKKINTMLLTRSSSLTDPSSPGEWTGEQKWSRPSRSSSLTDPSSAGEQKIHTMLKIILIDRSIISGRRSVWCLALPLSHSPSHQSISPPTLSWIFWVKTEFLKIGPV